MRKESKLQRGLKNVACPPIVTSPTRSTWLLSATKSFLVPATNLGSEYLSSSGTESACILAGRASPRSCPHVRVNLIREDAGFVVDAPRKVCGGKELALQQILLDDPPDLREGNDAQCPARRLPLASFPFSSDQALMPSKKSSPARQTSCAASPAAPPPGRRPARAAGASPARTASRRRGGWRSVGPSLGRQ
eukprot:scaffold317_cov260-Pinguiococcus_pyrenoidosus.AAC.16